MGVTKLTLASGNSFYHLQGNSDRISIGLITKDNIFLGGFAGKEADRKLKAFSALSNVVKTTVDIFPDVTTLDTTEYASKLGAASALFQNYLTLTIQDYRDCNGTSSKAQSCDERLRYFEVVGIESLYKTSQEIPMWAFIANHVSIFGVVNFKQSFFRGHEDIAKDSTISFPAEWKKFVYVEQDFKAPAPYIRALCQNSN